MTCPLETTFDGHRFVCTLPPHDGPHSWWLAAPAPDAGCWPAVRLVEDHLNDPEVRYWPTRFPGKCQANGCTIGSENRVLPAPLAMAGELAYPDETGVDMRHDTPTPTPRQERGN